MQAKVAKERLSRRTPKVDWTTHVKPQALAKLTLLALLLNSAPASFADEPLQGHVEETGIEPSTLAPPKPIEPLPVPVLPAKKRKHAGAEQSALPGEAQEDALQGNVRQDALPGGVEDSAANLTPGQGKIDPTTGMLKGSASKEGAGLEQGDPDEQDQELMIEWDRWRNRFLTAVQSGMEDRLNTDEESTLRWDPARQVMVSRSRYPLGISAWFSCRVTPRLEIVDLKLEHSSGYPGYDQAVLEAVRDLQGSSILRYPRGSKRRIVTQVAGIKTSATAQRQYFKFGDVERQRVPAR